MASLEEKLADLFSQLKSGYANPTENADDIARIKSQINEITFQINAEIDAENKKNGLKYSNEAGVFLTDEQITDEESHKLSGEEPDSGKKSESYSWRQKCQKSPIGGQEWYNNKQVEFLTGAEVPVGSEELGKLLAKGNCPTSFSYLMVPNKDDPTRNHFVSINLVKDKDGKVVEVTYLDSNGDLMQAAEMGVIKNQLPDAKIIYRDYEGKKISQENAEKNPANILRVQFDNNNCGVYSSYMTEVMSSAKTEEDIMQGIEKIKNIDPQQVRKEHSEYLQSGIAPKVANKAKEFAPTTRCGQEAQQGGLPLSSQPGLMGR